MDFDIESYSMSPNSRTGRIMAVYICSRALRGNIYLNCLRTNSLLEAFSKSLNTCSFQDKLCVRVTPRLVRLDVLFICVVWNTIGGRCVGFLLRLNTMKWVLEGLILIS